MKELVGFLILILALSSCKEFFHSMDVYKRGSRKQKFFQAAYQNQDTFCIYQFKTCHFYELPIFPLPTTYGYIFFDHDSIESSVIESYSNLFQISSYESDKEQLIEKDCEFIKKKPSKILKVDLSDSCENIIFPQICVSSISRRRFDIGANSSIDMGDDIHSIEYKLITSIYHKDTLIYMNNFKH